MLYFVKFANLETIGFKTSVLKPFTTKKYNFQFFNIDLDPNL